MGLLKARAWTLNHARIGDLFVQNSETLSGNAADDK